MTRIFNFRFFRSEVWILICWLPLSCVFSQTNPKADLRTADSNFEEGNFKNAIVYYNKYLESDHRNRKAIERLAFSLLQVRDLTSSIRRYRSLLTTRALKEPTILFYLAEAYHLNENYSEAIDYYKEFLKASKQKDDLHLVAIDRIKRCGVGLSNNSLKRGMLVENLGSDVNTVFDDFGPVESPNVSNRIYFTSNKRTLVVDLLGKRDQVIGREERQNSDLFLTEIKEGVWSKSQEMNIRLNTTHNEILGGFAPDGSIAYFWRGSNDQNGRWYVDSFSAESSSGTLWRRTPFYPESFQNGIYFFSDSLLIFSSNRPGGIGGFDLYYSERNKGRWAPPQNLGPEINTPFDEITPFLTLDGTTLYFSSNRLTSMGDFDVFKARYEREINKWLSPENLGKPVNSAGRDMGYCISWNGKYAFLGSDRSGGSGGLDLYSVYFYEPVAEQSIQSVSWLEDPGKAVNRPESINGKRKDPEIGENRNYKLPVLEFTDQIQTITGKNAFALDSIIRFLNVRPKYGISIFGIPGSSSDKNLELFLSVQSAKQVADYLRQRGVSPSKLYVRCFSSPYVQSDSNQNGNRNDQQIQFAFFHVDSLSHRGEQSGGPLMNNISGITFSVQFIETTQMYKGNILNEHPPGTVELVSVSNIMRYCSGIFRSFGQAKDLCAEIKALDVSKARIIPYLDGKRLNTEDISEDILEKYPELKDFMLIQN